jgi:hypothetical protein
LSEDQLLGHVVSLEGIAMDPGKVREVLDWKAQKTVHHFHSFLSLGGYYHRFILNFSMISKPITDLLNKEEKFV